MNLFSGAAMLILAEVGIGVIVAVVIAVVGVVAWISSKAKR